MLFHLGYIGDIRHTMGQPNLYILVLNMKNLILATTNQGKIAEFQSLLSPINCISQVNLGIESIAETGLSFLENALLKARHVSRAANKPALGDDSGLVVAALN